jgi:hypothetical protein
LTFRSLTVTLPGGSVVEYFFPFASYGVYVMLPAMSFTDITRR